MAEAVPKVQAKILEKCRFLSPHASRNLRVNYARPLPPANEYAVC